MNIFGFKIGKKHFIILGVVILLLVVVGSCNGKKSNDEDEERRAQIEAQREQEEKEAQEASMAEAQNLEPSEPSISEEEEEQKYYESRWGKPPEGFVWDDDGELVPISSDNMSCEDIVWTYLRALSMLDFSTVQKYTYNSQVASQYYRYFSDDNVGDASYYTQFVRKMYKLVLESIEVESVGHSAVFADGDSIVSVKLKLLDLTDKTFWKDDMEEIYSNLMNIYADEKDSVKAQQYVYDYLYRAYSSGKVGKREVNVEVKLTKDAQSGWLLSDDTDVVTAVDYTDGVDVASYIFEQYSDWYDDYVDSLE